MTHGSRFSVLDALAGTIATTRTIASRRQRGGTGRFVGRAREQELLRGTLRQLAALRDHRDEDLADDDLTYAQVFLVAAEGGMGKTTLLRRFQR